MRVRAARDDDGPQLQRIDAATWSEQVSPAPTPNGEWTFFGEHTRPADVVVAEVEGEVSGYVSIRPQYALQSSRHVQQIVGLAVAPERQNRGVGRRLVLAAIEVARGRGAGRVTLHVLGTNQAARRLYERCGFLVEGVQREQFVLGGRYVDDFLFARNLTAPHDASRDDR